MIRIPKIVEKYYPELTWRITTERKELYLTFDDGPTPEVTDWVLDQLVRYGAKATFFCIGKNVKKYQDIYKRIVGQGHSVGNHTYDHQKGWNTSNIGYMKNVMKCNELVPSNIFRPPYGKIRKGQIRALKSRFRIIMWDVLSEDYNASVDAGQCLHNVLTQSQNGSIIVFHDSVKAKKNLFTILPVVLEHFNTEGFEFKPIF